MRNRGAAAHPECIGAGVGLGSVAYKTRSQGMRMAWLGRLWLGEVGGRGGTCEGSSELEWGKQKKPEGRGGKHWEGGAAAGGCLQTPVAVGSLLYGFFLCSLHR